MNQIKVLEMIAADMKNDAEKFDGRPFNGKTVAEYLGNQGAAIAAFGLIPIKKRINITWRHMKCNCVQEPKLKPTGWSGDHPEWYCPVCGKEFYVDKNGKLTSERPAEWSKKAPGT